MSIIEGIIDGGSGGGGGPTTPPIGSIGLGRWTFNSSGSPASAGQISFNNALATELYIATVNADGEDAIDFIDNTISAGTIIYVQSNAAPDKAFSVKAQSLSVAAGLATIVIDQFISTTSGLSNGEKLGLTISQGLSNPDDIVQAINQSLGQNFWQQGISNAVFVNDWSEDSPELPGRNNGARDSQDW